MKFTKLTWIVNLLLFAVVVFLGIEQSGRGADISKLEKEIENNVELKRNLSEVLLNSGKSELLNNNAVSMGFVKPTNIMYLNNIDQSLTYDLSTSR